MPFILVDFQRTFSNESLSTSTATMNSCIHLHGSAAQFLVLVFEVVLNPGDAQSFICTSQSSNCSSSSSSSSSSSCSSSSSRAASSVAGCSVVTLLARYDLVANNILLIPSHIHEALSTNFAFSHYYFYPKSIVGLNHFDIDVPLFLWCLGVDGAQLLFGLFFFPVSRSLHGQLSTFPHHPSSHSPGELIWSYPRLLVSQKYWTGNWAMLVYPAPQWAGPMLLAKGSSIKFGRIFEMPG